MTATQTAALAESLPALRPQEGPPADDDRVEAWVQALCRKNPFA